MPPLTGLLKLGLAVATAAAATSCALVSPSPAMPPCQPNAAAACTVIDGYPVGVLARDCGPTGAGCADVAALARLALDAREPHHPPPTSVQQFDPDMARVCGAVVCVLSSQRSIIVFTFANGDRKATGYECPGVSPCVGTLTWGGFENAIHGPAQ